MKPAYNALKKVVLSEDFTVPEIGFRLVGHYFRQRIEESVGGFERFENQLRGRRNFSGFVQTVGDSAKGKTRGIKSHVFRI